MGLVSELIGGSIGKAFKDIVGTFKLSPEAKKEIDLAMMEAEDKIRVREYELQKIVEERETALIDAQKNIIMAEMNQQDTYTKRARPTIVYAGLAFIFLNHVFIPMYAFFSGRVIPNISLPAEFWWAWTGVLGIWIIGRTMEKNSSSRGEAPSMPVKLITGTK